MTKKRVLSGTRATGRLHLGNYLGAVKGYIELAENPEFETFYMVADLHSVNTPYNPKNFRERTRDVVLDYLACGLDPEKSTIFIQSLIPEQIELFYLLSTQVSVARMLHLPTYKEKVKLQPQDVNMALLNYPVLMAGDILAYKAHAVPVGVDQLPHLEIAREVARKMNRNFNTSFPEPQPFKTEKDYIPSLLGEGKMSKSIKGSYVNLTDGLKTIEKKLTKVPTDSGKGEIIPEKGGVASLMLFVELFQGKEKRKEYEDNYKNSGVSYRQLKKELAGAIYGKLKPIREKRRKMKESLGYVDEVINEGTKKARRVAGETLCEVREKMGLYERHC